jgi:D-alanyl-D-alanine dipeptidase
MKNNHLLIKRNAMKCGMALFVLLLSVGIWMGCSQKEKPVLSDEEKAVQEMSKQLDKKSQKSDYQNPEGFVLLTDVIPDAILEIRYYGTYNFAGCRIDGYQQPIALLTVEAAQALKAVSDDVKSMGYRLKIYDAYRPQCAVDHFVRWSKDTKDTTMKRYFYPMHEKPSLFQKGYIASKSGHTRGSTVDLTLFDMQTEKEVDMGGTFDWFGEESHPSHTESLTKQQIANRNLLRDAMMRHGFKPLPTEWWHFTLKDEPYPDTYFTHPVRWE